MIMDDVQKINLEDYVQTGEGGTAITYTHKVRNTVAKLYFPGFEADRAKDEFLTAQTVFEMGISTPEPYRLVTDGERFGAEYELIRNKRSFSRIISQEPERLPELAVKFADMAKSLHSKKADTSRLKSTKEKIRQFYLERCNVPDYYKQKALAFLETVPDTPNCVHGDLQISNVITDEKNDYWIDVGDFGYGVPEWDLAWCLSMMLELKKERSEELFHMKFEKIREFWNCFFPNYIGTTDPLQIEEATKKLYPYAGIKIPYMLQMAGFNELPERILQPYYKFLE